MSVVVRPALHRDGKKIGEPSSKNPCENKASDAVRPLLQLVAVGNQQAQRDADGEGTDTSELLQSQESEEASVRRYAVRCRSIWLCLPRRQARGGPARDQGRPTDGETLADGQELQSHRRKA